VKVGIDRKTNINNLNAGGIQNEPSSIFGDRGIDEDDTLIGMDQANVAAYLTDNCSFWDDGGHVRLYFMNFHGFSSW
jgi:hypothetical protein